MLSRVLRMSTPPSVLRVLQFPHNYPLTCGRSLFCDESEFSSELHQNRGVPPPAFVSARDYRAYRSAGLNWDPIGPRHPRDSAIIKHAYTERVFFTLAAPRRSSSNVASCRAACRPKLAIRFARFARESTHATFLIASAAVTLRARRNATPRVVSAATSPWPQAVSELAQNDRLSVRCVSTFVSLISQQCAGFLRKRCERCRKYVFYFPLGSACQYTVYFVRKVAR